MSDKELSDIEIRENKGDTALAGRDITSTVVGDTTIGEIFNSITSINIPSDNTDEKLEESLKINRDLLKRSKRTLALLVMEGSRRFKEMKTAVRNIKMSGDNISNLINVLSVRGIACEHLPDEDNYEHEIIEILSLKSSMKFNHVDRVCPHCGEKIKIKNRFPDKEMISAIKKPEKSLYIFSKCIKYSEVDHMDVCRTSSMYCNLCKNPICLYFSALNSSMTNYIDSNYPE